MRRAARVVVFAGLAVVGLGAGAFVTRHDASANALRSAPLSNMTHVTVNATDFRFKLSTHHAVTGTVIFTVSNRGKVSHDFKIAGKKTRRLSHGHSATLRVKFSKKGRYPYRSTVHGQAAGLMVSSWSWPRPHRRRRPLRPGRSGPPRRQSKSECSSSPRPSSFSRS